MDDNSASEMDLSNIDQEEFAEPMTLCDFNCDGKSQKSIEGFIYLWNMLRRSNFYASNLLSVINKKQKKRLLKRRLESLRRLRIARDKSKLESQDLEKAVQATLDFLVDSVELKLSDDFNQSLHSVDFDDDDEVESSDENDFCDAGSTSGSKAFSEIPDTVHPVSPVFDDQDSNKNDYLMEEDQSDEQLIPLNEDDEDEYLCTLSKRRGPNKRHFVSCQLGIKTEPNDVKSDNLNGEISKNDKSSIVDLNEKGMNETAMTISKSTALPIPTIKQEKVIDCLPEKGTNEHILFSPKSKQTKVTKMKKCFLPSSKNIGEIKPLINSSVSFNTHNKPLEKQVKEEKNGEKHITKPSDEIKFTNSELISLSPVKNKVEEEKKSENNSIFKLSDTQSPEGKDNSSKTGLGVVKTGKEIVNQECNIPKEADKFKSNKVECPICGQMIGVKAINKHLDICIGHTAKRKSLRNSSSSGNDHIELPLTRERKKPKLSSLDRQQPQKCHGIDSIKSVLERSLKSSHAVKSFVAEQAKSVESGPEIKNIGFSGSFIKPTRTPNISRTPRIAFKRIFSRPPDPSESDEEDEQEEEVFVPPAPTRKSSRSSASKITYKEVNTDSSDEDPIKVGNKIKRPSLKKRKTSKKNDDDFEPDQEETNQFDDGDDIGSGTDMKSNNKTTEGGKEEGEVDENDVDVDALLKRKFHKYDPDASVLSTKNKFYEREDLHPGQPKLLTGGRLRDYQVTGYEWLKILFENGESGILADEMGLGKTIQSISMVCKLVSSGVSGPFLICTPMSTIKNWFEEFKRFAPTITVLLLHGTSPERIHLGDCLTKEVKMKTQVVVITSYEVLRRDLRAMKSYNWSYMVLDEGHRIKNVNSKTLKCLKTLSIQSKLMLTGTPLQNNVIELWALLNFLMPQMFDNVEAFESAFDMAALQKDERILSILHQVLTPFVLRRVKSDVDLKIPQKREIVVKAPLAQHQEKLYRATVDRSIRKLLESRKYYDVAPGVADPDRLAANSQEEQDEDILNAPRKTRSQVPAPSKQNSNPVEENQFVVNITLNNMMMQLRKCCNHPYLIHCPIKPSDDKLQEIVHSCGKMMLLDRMLPPLKERQHKVLLFSQMTSMLDILEEYCSLKKFEYVRFDGTTKSEQRYEYIEEFNSNPDIFIFLLSTRAGGLGINLTGADTVIIYDSDWNPQNDMQAQDRCHRIGQEKPVLVYRLVTMATIDQQIVERATMKRKLEKMIMHQAKFKGHLEKELKCKTISPEELLILLQSKNGASDELRNKESVISDKELNILLDRSNMISNQNFSEND